MIEKKRVDIDNMDEFLSIELDKNISVGDIIDILDIEYKEYVSCYTILFLYILFYYCYLY
jgi:hypothetical protein